ncbi:hypothetical protein C0Q70_16990 [Pomacea canaliculata]|uniref:Nucleoporin NDC1 n=1 Tax=Pomacea canaliculata TaxID=400727 RepID=A0A2T7NRC3_POMCA|nr:hypothetical protein C0Q70_16990 [Pomacea canaliculata]
MEGDQRLEFPVLPGFNSPSKYCLNEALICNDALLQHLAFLDLSHLSSTNMARRQEVFSLSQPGGHPYTWRAIASTCLQQVDMLVTKVHIANAAKLASVPLQQHPEKIFHTTVSDDELLKDVLKTSSQKPSLLSRVRAILMTKPVLSYFLMELPDAKSRQLFATCQIPIWAIEALSHLAAASYREDKYGVVQQSLPTIITSLVTLHDNVEKYFKLQPPALRRYGRETPVAPRLLLSQQLRETLKTSIYRLTDTFSSHLGIQS